MWAIPGKKLLFMGDEFGQTREWNHDDELGWALLDEPGHRGVLDWVQTLNHLLAAEPALHREDHHPSGFKWVEPEDYSHATVAFLRLAVDQRPVLVLINFTPVDWDDYLVGVPERGPWEVLATSDDLRFGGHGLLMDNQFETVARPNQGYDQSLALTLPPLSATFIAPVRSEKT